MFCISRPCRDALPAIILLSCPVPSGTRPCITRYKRTKSSQCRDKTTNGTASRQGRDYASFMQNRLSISPSLASINRLYSSAKTIALGGGCFATVATDRKTFFGGTVIDVTPQRPIWDKDNSSRNRCRAGTVFQVNRESAQGLLFQCSFNAISTLLKRRNSVNLVWVTR